MGVDAGENLLGHGQGVAARFAGDPRLARRADRLDEIVELQGQGIDGVERQLLLRQVLFGEMLRDSARPARASAHRRGTAAAAAFRWGGRVVAVRAAKSMAAKPSADQTCIRRTAS